MEAQLGKEKMRWERSGESFCNFDFASHRENGSARSVQELATGAQRPVGAWQQGIKKKEPDF